MQKSTVADTKNGFWHVMLEKESSFLIYGSGDTVNEAMKDHDQNLSKFIERCVERGLELNKDKMMGRVTYMGHVISRDHLISLE